MFVLKKNYNKLETILEVVRKKNNKLECDINKYSTQILKVYPNLQVFFFKEALAEHNMFFKNEDFTYDHINAITTLKKIHKFPIIFPKRLALNQNQFKKSFDYIFIGKITKNREWVLKYEGYKNSIVKNSNYGRKVYEKYLYDQQYYQQLLQSKFTLCPLGDHNWSYRFLEAIMCFSIPILRDDETDLNSKNFFYYKESQEHFYDLNIVNQNYKIFLKNHTLDPYQLTKIK